MEKGTEITQESFNTLLNWLDSDREIAGQKYEKIRHRLIRIFVGRGVDIAEELADETINRVIKKAGDLIKTYDGEPILYFYGVANNLHIDYLRKRKQNPIENLQTSIIQENTENYETEKEYECLELCLKKLPPHQRRFIVEYYRGEKSEKINHRKHLAEKMAISLSASQVKAFRLRSRLKECLQKCIAENM